MTPEQRARAERGRGFDVAEKDGLTDEMYTPQLFDIRITSVSWTAHDTEIAAAVLFGDKYARRYVAQMNAAPRVAGRSRVGSFYRNRARRLLALFGRGAPC